MRHRFTSLGCAALLASTACSSSPKDDQVTEGACQIADASNPPDSLSKMVCKADFDTFSSAPIDTSLPGARSLKVVLDRADTDTLYFQNTARFQIHYDFASTHLSGNGLPIVPALAQFNSTEYFSPDRRFLLGAVTWYEGPQKWALELSPYDTASAEMITRLYEVVSHAAYFGPSLWFHPTSQALATTAESLPDSVPVITTDDLYAGIDYQPLSLGSAMGRLHFTTAANLASEYVSYQSIVVLDEAPNDISVVQGIITQEFQTPLSHVNVLSRNWHTPNMGLRNALQNAELLALDGQLIELTVTADDWSVRTVTQAEAEAYWAAHAPAPVTLPPANLTVEGLVDIADVTPEPTGAETLREALGTAVRAFGGKAAHYSILYRTPGVPIQNGFAVPIYYYDQFMKQNGFYDRLDLLLADPQFVTDPSTRDAALAQFRADMLVAPMDAGFQALLQAKVAAEYTGTNKLRFRSSSNSEDLEGFPCAGCYESHSGLTADLNDMLTAIREVYADAWSFRTFELRSYYSVDHKSVGMALLVHPNFPNEEANGVAVTANPFDPTGLAPAFYVNVQFGGDVEVVAPPAGVSSDQFLHYFYQPGQPVAYIAHSSLITAGTTVLTTTQVHELGVALDLIKERFSAAYGPASGNAGWYGLEVDFKFDNDAAPALPPALYIKQARPYPDPYP